MKAFALILALAAVALAAPVSRSDDVCTPTSCPAGEICVPTTRYCIRAPCPQFVCQSPCQDDSCAADEICVPEPKQCITSPCPQFRCDKKDECQPDSCAADEICVPEPKQCITTPCPQFRCDKVEADVCQPDSCAADEVCVPEPKQCITTPCPQFRCDKVEADVCQPDSCAADEVCVPEPKQCFTTPCPQFRCDKTEEEEQSCVMCPMFMPTCSERCIDCEYIPMTCESCARAVCHKECPERCPKVHCKRNYYPVTKPGECCPECVRDCRNVLCALPKCKDGYEAVVPEGECCPKCVRKECSFCPQIVPQCPVCGFFEYCEIVPQTCTTCSFARCRSWF